MKKSLLYVVAAVMLGVATMLTPLRFLSTSGVFKQPQISADKPNFLTSESRSAVAQNELASGVTPNYPLDEIYAGLMSTFSLVLAFIVFRQTKKKTA